MNGILEMVSHRKVVWRTDVGCTGGFAHTSGALFGPVTLVQLYRAWHGGYITVDKAGGTVHACVPPSGRGHGSATLV